MYSNQEEGVIFFGSCTEPKADSSVYLESVKYDVGLDIIALSEQSLQEICSGQEGALSWMAMKPLFTINSSLSTALDSNDQSPHYANMHIQSTKPILEWLSCNLKKSGASYDAGVKAVVSLRGGVRVPRMQLHYLLLVMQSKHLLQIQDFRDILVSAVDKCSAVARHTAQIMRSAWFIGLGVGH